MSAAEPEVMTGAWSQFGEPLLAAELGSSGASWVGLDMQHGHYDDRAVREALRVSRPSPAHYLVRTTSSDPSLIGRALDAGADGVIVPLIETPEAATAVVHAVQYPPRGSRSYGPLTSVGNYVNAEIAEIDPIVAVMIETQLGLDNVEAVAQVPGLDMIFVGPFDLALSLGCSVDELLADRAPTAALARIVRACKDNGISRGAFAGSPSRGQALVELGFTWVASCTETTIIRDGFAANHLR